MHVMANEGAIWKPHISDQHNFNFVALNLCVCVLKLEGIEGIFLSFTSVFYVCTRAHARTHTCFGSFSALHTSSVWQ